MADVINNNREVDNSNHGAAHSALNELHSDSRQEQLAMAKASHNPAASQPERTWSEWLSDLVFHNPNHALQWEASGGPEQTVNGGKK